MNIRRLMWARNRFQRYRLAVATAPTPETRREMFASLLEVHRIERGLAREEISAALPTFTRCPRCSLFFAGDRCQCPGRWAYDLDLEFGSGWWRAAD